MKIELYYDKQCPFCNSYANYIKLKKEHNLILINARESFKDIKLFRTKGFDINDGFIIKVDENEIYQGADAIIFLNELAKRKVYFPNNSFFKLYVYTFIKTLRKIVLFILGKKSDLFL